MTNRAIPSPQRIPSLRPAAAVLVTGALWLTHAIPARADIPPAGYRECDGLAAGAECEVGGEDGRCVDTTCYTSRPRCQGPDCPPDEDDGSYDCRLCKPGAPAPASSNAASKSGCGCGGSDAGATAGLVAVALAVLARRARRAVV